MSHMLPSSMQESWNWQAHTVSMGYDVLERMERAVQKVRDRLIRATQALNAARIPYAVVGGHAVASWVARIDEGAVRTTRDVDILVQRQDLPAIIEAMTNAGFVFEQVIDVFMFRDGPDGKPSEAIHLLFTGEALRPDHVLPMPDIDTVDDPANFRVIKLQSLIEMKLLSNRRKDQVHIEDLASVGLIDASWLPRFHPVLAERLKSILDTPDN